ncbi:DUF1702 family protein [Maribacter dokdonensis]|uniref:DUF1702 family protein n=1 Tax=Maribacter dokdonensis TaxID=320912 RepID=UPI001C0A3ABF|nr:DUF1702 family protein [Maribacter dokdonensis]MBU2902971.1 DUF1702 family protein [Maribacter dokdonensis]
MEKFSGLKRFMFGLPLGEAEFQKRGFYLGENAQQRLEHVAKTVVEGYNYALFSGLSKDLLFKREMINRELKGFFNEGVGMGLYTLDLISLFRKNRFWQFVKGHGKGHEYMSYIGAGIACGVFKYRPIDSFLEKASPTSGLLILNGIGFYYAYFKPKKTINKLYIPKDLKHDDFYIYCYDNGIGRALWFYCGGNPKYIADEISKFPKARRAGIWAGIGLAATYAGGVPILNIEKLLFYGVEFRSHLAEGAILAIHTRDIAGNPHEDNQVSEKIIGKTYKSSIEYAARANKFLDNKRYLLDKHSLEVFFNSLRSWVTHDLSDNEAVYDSKPLEKKQYEALKTIS